jgi:hypothetical protein
MYLDSNEIYNTSFYSTIKDMVHCTICLGIMHKPQQCLTCDTCYCKKCIKKWIRRSDSCPMKCPDPTFKECRITKNVLSKLIFKCPNQCEEGIPYDYVDTHEVMCTKSETICRMCYSIVKRTQINNNYDMDIAKLIKKNRILKKKNKNLENQLNNNSIYEASDMSDQDEAYVPSMFRKNKSIVTIKDEVLRTKSCTNPLPENFNIKIKLKEISHPGHISIGVSDTEIKRDEGILGGDFGSGNWGLAGNGALGEGGQWTQGLEFKEGDIINLIGKGSVITYMINEESPPGDYKYDLGKKPLYLTFTFYYANQKIELVD